MSKVTFQIGRKSFAVAEAIAWRAFFLVSLISLLLLVWAAAVFWFTADILQQLLGVNSFLMLACLLVMAYTAYKYFPSPDPRRNWFNAAFATIAIYVIAYNVLVADWSYGFAFVMSIPLLTRKVW